MKQRIINYIRAGYPGLYLVSPEEQRVDAEMKQIAEELKYHLVFWSAVDGLVDASKGTTSAANDPLEALIAIRELKPVEGDEREQVLGGHLLPSQPVVDGLGGAVVHRCLGLGADVQNGTTATIGEVDDEQLAFTCVRLARLSVKCGGCA
jgi:hypothetical protein